MPDRDIFYTSVPYNWFKAARLAFGSEDDSVAIEECERALVRDLNEAPWNEFQDAISDVVDAEQAGGADELRRSVLDGLDRFRGKWRADRYGSMRRVANRRLVNASSTTRAHSASSGEEDLETKIAVAVLADLVSRQIGPACLAARLRREGKMDEITFVQRAKVMADLLANSPGIQRLATQMLRSEHGSGRRIKVPNTRLPVPNQGDLIQLGIG